MTLPMLLDDALSATDTGFALRLSLPWIRSMPLAAVTDLVVTVDGDPVTVHAVVEDRVIAPADLAREEAWWFIQDRLELRGEGDLDPGRHEVGVAFVLAVPYLQAGPAGPLTFWRRRRWIGPRTSSRTAPTARST